MAVSKALGTYGDGAGVVTPLDHKLAQLGLITKTGAGTNTVRSGVFYDGVANLVLGKANMSYDVAPFTAALSRGAAQGAVLLANDGIVNVATTAAPGSNSRIDRIYVWPREFSIDGSNSTPVLGVAQGTPASSPVAPAIPAGAFELARAVVPAGVTATNSGVTITQTAPFTALAGGTVAVRNVTERDAGAWAPGQKVLRLDTQQIETFLGGAWGIDAPPVSRAYLQGTLSNLGNAGNNAVGDIPSAQSASEGAALSSGTNAIVINQSGWYQVDYAVTWSSNNNGDRLVDVTVNNSVPAFPVGDRRGAASTGRSSGGAPMYLTAGQVLRLRVQHSAGANVLLTATGVLSARLIRFGPAPA